MSITGLLHVAMTVRSMDRSIAFYTEVLELDLAGRGLFDASPAQRKSIFGSARAVVEMANLHGPGLAIEMFSFIDPPSRGNPRARAFRTVGLKHIAFHVTRFDRFVARLRRRRVPFQFDPIRLDRRTGLKMLYFHDPDRTTIEILGR